MRKQAQWNYDSAKQEYDFYLKVKTIGWVAFGFATTAPNNMHGCDVAIGGITSGGTPYLNVRLILQGLFENILSRWGGRGQKVVEAYNSKNT